MSVDIRLIKLRRRAINNKELWKEHRLSPDECNAFSMDYFDIVSVKSFSSSGSLEEIMDIGNIGAESRDDVSMQSYSLYCDADTLNGHKADLAYGDPFLHLDSDGGMPFLSIIQVHITPEVLARVNYPSERACIEAFIEDLHLIVKDFLNYHNDQNWQICYRVYQSLSAGDFAVVMRSDFPEASFYISSLIRRRTVKRQKEAAAVLVLYKTYTVLSICNNGKEMPAKETANGLVIRCCFSNKYWSQKAKIDEELSVLWNPNLIKSLHSLNGRYDFTVELTENEFHRIFPVIGQYKGFPGYISQQAECNMKKKIADGQLFGIEDYLCYLIVNGYLSYVNERYLLHTECRKEMPYKESAINTVPYMEGDVYLSDKNEKVYKRLWDKSEKLNVRIARLNSYQKNLNYYYILLQKLLHLCQTINGLSDMRIYAGILLRQIACVFDGIEDYIEIMEQRENSTILFGLTDFLRKSVCALDAFAQYIRDNNLQSLQTPNYSLQSSVSMEKLLLGYGEFLDELLEGYRQSNFSKKIGKTTEGFRTVLIPAMQDGQFSIEIMFSDIFLQKQSKNRKLMVVKCSTLQELTDVPNMIAACFHEIAHQFRFESRQKRNCVLVRYGAYSAFQPLIKRVSKELCKNIPGMNESREIEDVLLAAAVRAFKEAWENYLEECRHGQYEEESLLIFQLYLTDMMCLLWDDDTSWEAFTICRNCFLEDLKPKTEESHILDLESPAVKAAIIHLKNAESLYLRINPEKDSLTHFLTKLKNAACYLWKKVYLDPGLKEDEEDWERMDADKNRLNCISDGNKTGVDHYSLSIFLKACDQIGLHTWEEAIVGSIRQSFLKQFYMEAVKGWEKYKNLSRLRGGGRYLGIDDCFAEENQREFAEYIQAKMHDMQDSVVENIGMAIDLYREETSDIYMCIMLGLTPFGYVNFMARNIPSEIGTNMSQKDVLRILAVIYSMLEKKPAESEDLLLFNCFSGISRAIFLNLKKTIHYFGENQDLILPISIEDVWKDEDIIYSADWHLTISCMAGRLRDFCRECRGELFDQKQITAGKNKLQEELLHYQYLCNILIDLIKFYSYDLLEQIGFEYVKDDLQYGFSAWKDLRIEMEKEICWEYCIKAAYVLNEPSRIYGPDREKIMDQTLRFLQNMYYRHKMKCGKQIRLSGKGDGGENL